MTVRAPSVCPQCHGAGTQTYVQNGKTVWTYCEGCRCAECGKYTTSAPQCRDCAIREDNDERRRDA